jgi:hypothetical protein
MSNYASRPPYSFCDLFELRSYPRCSAYGFAFPDENDPTQDAVAPQRTLVTSVTAISDFGSSTGIFFRFRRTSPVKRVADWYPDKAEDSP